MLRGIYAFHLTVFGVFVFMIGLLLIPFGYLAVIGIRARLLILNCRIRNRTQTLLARTVSPNRYSELFSSVVSLIWFMLLGMIVLLIRNFNDCFTFVGDCWKEHREADFHANVIHSRVPLKE